MKRCIATTDTGKMHGQPVVVVGGGIGGLTAALCFAFHGARVTVLEQAPALTEVGAGLQITPNGAVVLARLGLGAAVKAAGIRAQAVCPTDAVSGRRLARFDLTRLSGEPYRFLHRADLLGLLAKACQLHGVEVRTGVKVVGVDGSHLRLSHGDTHPAAFIVGADGVHSVLRPYVNDPGTPFFTGQVAWRAVVQADAPPEARIWMAPGRHVVTYPLTQGRLNIVAVQEQAAWAPDGWSHDDDPMAMQSTFADTCPDLQAILARVTQTRKWGLFRHAVAAQWHKDNIALIGDAAHPTLPFLAQGANLAIEDAWVLASVCDRGLGLPAYQVLRRARVARAIAAANANARNYHLAGVRRVVAHAGLRVIGAVSPQMFLRRMDWLYGRDVTRDWGMLLKPGQASSSIHTGT